MQFHMYVLYLYFEIHLFLNDVFIFSIYIFSYFIKDNSELILIYFDNNGIYKRDDLFEWYCHYQFFLIFYEGASIFLLLL